MLAALCCSYPWLPQIPASQTLVLNVGCTTRCLPKNPSAGAAGQHEQNNAPSSTFTTNYTLKDQECIELLPLKEVPLEGWSSHETNANCVASTIKALKCKPRPCLPKCTHCNTANYAYSSEPPALRRLFTHNALSAPLIVRLHLKQYRAQPSIVTYLVAVCMLI